VSYELRIIKAILDRENLVFDRRLGKVVEKTCKYCRGYDGCEIIKGNLGTARWCEEFKQG